MQMLTAFFACLFLLLSAIPGAIMDSRLNAPLLQARWRILAGGLWAHQDIAYDIIIVAGQSNAEGSGFGPVGDIGAKQPAFQPDDRIQMMPCKANLLGGYGIQKVAEKVGSDGRVIGNFGLSFAREYIESGRLAEGRKVLILQAAVGGTGFSDRHWGPQDDHYNNMLKMIGTALALNPENEIKALLWHQGETDAALKANRQTHAANLQALVWGVRSKAGIPDLPFVAGDFVQHWIGLTQDDANLTVREVQAAMRDVCGRVGAAAFVETDGINSNWEDDPDWQDSIHFSRAGLIALGTRYFEAYLDILG